MVKAVAHRFLIVLQQVLANNKLGHVNRHHSCLIRHNRRDGIWNQIVEIAFSMTTLSTCAKADKASNNEENSKDNFS